jgi:hypothetical protein
MPIPTASGDFAAFFPMLFDSIQSVSGTNGGVDPGDQLNQYVRPTVPSLPRGAPSSRACSPATGTRRTCRPR